MRPMKRPVPVAITPDLTGSGLGIIHMNCQSLFPKLGELELLMHDIQPDILCLTETWLNDSIPDDLLNFQNYTIFRLDRLSAGRGGGVAIYIRNSTLSDCILKEHRDIWKSNNDIEIQLIELKIRNNKKIILTNVYRPPSGKTDKFVSLLSETLD